MKVTAVFDIGKTNKKFFLFDKDYKEVYKNYTRFPEIMDDDGFPCDDLEAITDWVKSSIKEVFDQGIFEVKAINFSTYGASFVHIDKSGNPVTPLYNYLKPYPEELLTEFYKKHGDQRTFARETASPQLGMLNSGMQLYWLKQTKPEIFSKIRWSLHFPQYLSFVLTGIPVSEFTSIGCHTNLWDFDKNDYHNWVFEEGIDMLLPPVISTQTSINTKIYGKQVKVGVGIHDSSSALLPYLRADKKPFLLISTGTWSISLNPFDEGILTDEELRKDCLKFLRVNGNPVKAARLFLGNEYKLQSDKLQEYYEMPEGSHKTVLFNEDIYNQLQTEKKRYFHFESIDLERDQPEKSNYEKFASFEEAYHQLMIELVDLQVDAVKRAMGDTVVRKLYIDGGFADNDLYVKMLSLNFPDLKLRTTQSPLGSSLGASIVISNDEIKKKFLKKHYAMRKIKWFLGDKSQTEENRFPLNELTP